MHLCINTSIQIYMHLCIMVHDLIIIIIISYFINMFQMLKLLSAVLNFHLKVFLSGCSITFQELYSNGHVKVLVYAINLK